MKSSSKFGLSLFILCCGAPLMAGVLTTNLEVVHKANNCNLSEVFKDKVASLEWDKDRLFFQKINQFTKDSFLGGVALSHQPENQSYFASFSEVTKITGVCSMEYHQTYHIYSMEDDVYLYYLNHREATGPLERSCKKTLPNEGCVSTFLFKLSDLSPADIGL